MSALRGAVAVVNSAVGIVREVKAKRRLKQQEDEAAALKAAMAIQ